ncbi:MAG: YaaR family protein [Oscillospiraceae bacterium]
MKVKSLGTVSKGADLDFIVERRRDASDSQQSFDRHLKSLGQELYEERMAELAVEIEEQGQRLKQKADIAEMERYRELIAQLLSEVVSGAYAFRKEKTINARGRLKVCATICKINQKLEEIAERILTGCKDSIEIISRIDDIRGLIIDMML